MSPKPTPDGRCGTRGEAPPWQAGRGSLPAARLGLAQPCTALLRHSIGADGTRAFKPPSVAGVPAGAPDVRVKFLRQGSRCFPFKKTGRTTGRLLYPPGGAPDGWSSGATVAATLSSVPRPGTCIRVHPMNKFMYTYTLISQSE